MKAIKKQNLDLTKAQEQLENKQKDIEKLTSVYHTPSHKVIFRQIQGFTIPPY
jgi:hypothetical protein